MIELRVLTADDWPLWRGLRLAALAEAPRAFGSRLADWQGEGDREERWRARLSMRGAHDLVAIAEGRPVGMVSGVPTDDSAVVELISMWVAPAVRGLGVGDLLIGAVERWARDANAEAVRLNVVEDNRAAVALYRRNGFHHVEAPGEPPPDGALRERRMVKRLGAATG